MRCPQCQAENEDGSKFCSNCGAALPLQQVYCPRCGAAPLTVDVWTDKGGMGANVAGGRYEVGEEVTIYVEVSTTCQAIWTLTGPSGATSEEQPMDAGIYDLDLGQAEGADIGQWEMVFEVRADGQYASDSTCFAIVAVEPEPSPTPSEPGEELTAKIDASNATELYALMALKMAEGSLPVDLNMDADGDGQVTREDARLILEWAVKGG